MTDALGLRVDDYIFQQYPAPPHFQADLRAWVCVLRGNGKRPSPAMPWNTIRGYMIHVAAVLATWDHLASLNQVTEEEVEAAAVSYSYLTGLRSLFRALRRERRIFRDPARKCTSLPPSGSPGPSRPTGSEDYWTKCLVPRANSFSS
ncbi:hypothetical protein ABZ746_12275 [Streptomyces sp. NPDC020096]